MRGTEASPTIARPEDKSIRVYNHAKLEGQPAKLHEFRAGRLQCCNIPTTWTDLYPIHRGSTKQRNAPDRSTRIPHDTGSQRSLLQTRLSDRIAAKLALSIYLRYIIKSESLRILLPTRHVENAPPYTLLLRPALHVGYRHPQPYDPDSRIRSAWG